MESLGKGLVSKLNRSTSSSSILFYFNKLSPTGVIRLPIRKRSILVLTLSEREGITRGIVADFSPALKDWAQGYLNREYEIDGVVDLFPHKETLYR
jgi:hypothetical protein